MIIQGRTLRIMFCGIRHRLDWQLVTDVSEEVTASVFNVNYITIHTYTQEPFSSNLRQDSSCPDHKFPQSLQILSTQCVPYDTIVVFETHSNSLFTTHSIFRRRTVSDVVSVVKKVAAKETSMIYIPNLNCHSRQNCISHQGDHMRQKVVFYLIHTAHCDIII